MQLRMKNGLIRKTISACSILVAMAAAIFVAPINANAEDLRNVSCSVHVDFLFNNVLRATYQRDFVVSPGVDFDEDISTVTRFGFFHASTSLEADKSYVVTMNFDKDVGVFDFVDFRTQLTLRQDRLAETNQASHSYFTSQGASGERTTNWTLTCTRVKP
jgi:hypothetical protein